MARSPRPPRQRGEIPRARRPFAQRPRPAQFGVAGDKPVTARVRIAPERAALVEREVGSDRVVARRRNGSIEVTVPASNAGAFASWVLGLAEHAEVLSPKPVRESLIARLEVLARSPRRRRRTR